MSLFLDAFDQIIIIEGGYSDNPSDSGGKTMYGITESVARYYGYKGQMKDLSKSFAHFVYKEGYWDSLYLDKVSIMSKNVAFEMFDTAVNTGIVSATIFLQRCLNVLNLKSRVYKDIVVDGRMGPATLSSLQSHLNHRRSDETLYKMLNALQGAYYIELAERREKDEDFIYGWFKHRVS